MGPGDGHGKRDGPDLLAAIAEAEAVDERLMAHARIEQLPHGYTLEIAVPGPA
jgi:hypothetical protein